jgi:hypothetical protein
MIICFVLEVNHGCTHVSRTNTGPSLHSSESEVHLKNKFLKSFEVGCNSRCRERIWGDCRLVTQGLDPSQTLTSTVTTIIRSAPVTEKSLYYAIT